MSSEKNLFSAFEPVSREAWEAVIEEDLRGADYKTKLKWQTGEGIEALPFYRRQDRTSWPEALRPAGNDWQVRQPVDVPDPAEANRIARHALQNGADAVEFTVRVQRTEGAIGGDMRGVAVQDQADFETLTSDIDPAAVPLHFDCGLAAPALLAMWHNRAGNDGASGSLMYDPFAFILDHGQLPKAEDRLFDEARQLADFCGSRLPGVRPLGVDVRTYHRAGATIVQQLGYALAAGSEYLARLSDRGLDADTAARGIHFTFPAGSNYFLEIAKFRAARILWRSVLGAYDAPAAGEAYLHGTSSSWNKSMYDPYVNMLRTTTEGMSAAIAGCDAITLHPFDATFCDPDDFSRRIARNTQTILKEESYFDKVADPAAGSYYVEILTDKIAEAAWNCFREIEQQGGLLQSIRDGFVQTAIAESRAERDRAIATRRRTFVGTNQYPNPEDRAPDAAAAQGRPPVTSLRETDTEVAPDTDSGLIDSLKNALNEGAALGDLIPALFDIQRQDIPPLRPYRGPQAFEALRQATEKNNSTPQVLTLPLGNKKMRKARSSFAVNLLGCAGYDITDPLGYDSVEQAIEAVGEQQPDIVVICSSDEEYRQLVPELCDALEQAELDPIVVLAGYPREQLERYRRAGVDMFIHANSNVLETLQAFQQQLGIISAHDTGP